MNYVDSLCLSAAQVVDGPAGRVEVRAPTDETLERAVQLVRDTCTTPEPGTTYRCAALCRIRPGSDPQEGGNPLGLHTDREARCCAWHMVCIHEVSDAEQ